MKSRFVLAAAATVVACMLSMENAAGVTLDRGGHHDAFDRHMEWYKGDGWYGDGPFRATPAERWLSQQVWGGEDIMRDAAISD